MKKFFYILSIALLGAVSCSLNEPVNVDKENGVVTLIMKVTFPETFVTTKGEMAIQPNIDNIYVAVFGTEHYLNDYVKAVRIIPTFNEQTGEITSYTESNSFAGIENDQDFYFKVSLTATQTKRFVHVIANGPAYLDFNTYEDDIMKSLTTEGNEGAYWTYVILPNGTATPSGDPLPDAEERLSNLRLIRNFARVHLDVAPSVTNFTLTGYEVFNKPTHGSVAVWDANQAHQTDDANSGFYPNYFTKDFEELWHGVPAQGGQPAQPAYSVFMPNDEISSAVPSAVGTYNANDKFIFERPDRATDRPYIIIKGRYTGDTADTFYRLDFVDRDGNYLPILRNYEYDIILTSVAKSGVADPKDAKPANANVSSMTETENLADLSDGVSRIYVEWLDQTYMGAGTQTFHYMYLMDAANHEVSTKATLEIRDGAGQAITGNLTQPDDPETTGGYKGWYTVTFTTTSPGTGDKKTVFRVTGQTEDGQKLYRDIAVHVLPVQIWGSPTATTVSTSGSAIDSKVTVTITLPTGLPSSIFPLQIYFEDSNKKLNPYGTDMPTNIGASIVPNNSNTSYQFVKSISYLDYADPETGSNVIACEFKRIATGATTLYFKNQYFTNASGGTAGVPGSIPIPAN